MGGSFSSVTQEWELASDDELRKRMLNAVHTLFPSYRSFAVIDDELSFSLLDIEGSGLISEIALHSLVKRCGYKMERWQLQYLLQRLDSDGDGMIGFADFILFMHNQDPKVAQKRGIRGPRAMNVALANSHLQGNYTKVFSPDTSDGVSDAHGLGGCTSPISTRPGSGGDILLFDNRKMLSLHGTKTQGRDRHEISSHSKIYLRKNRGNFINFDQFRPSGGVTTQAGATSSAAGSTRLRPSTSNSLLSKSGNTINGLPVSCMFNYAGDEVKNQADKGNLKRRETECRAMFGYLGEVFEKQESDRINRIRKSAVDKVKMNAIGRKVIGKDVIWRTDAGEPGDISHLVRAGPCYWDSSREHLHEDAFSESPPPLGKPLSYMSPKKETFYDTTWGMATSNLDKTVSASSGVSATTSPFKSPTLKPIKTSPQSNKSSTRNS